MTTTVPTDQMIDATLDQADAYYQALAQGEGPVDQHDMADMARALAAFTIATVDSYAAGIAPGDEDALAIARRLLSATDEA